MTEVASDTASNFSAASLVEQVLASSGVLGKDDLTTKLDNLSHRTDTIKQEVYDAVHKKYVDFIPGLSATVALSQQFDSLLHSYDTLSGKIQKEIRVHYASSSVEFEQLLEKLETTKLTITILKRVLEIYELLEMVDVQLKSLCYEKALNCLLKAKALIDKAVAEGDGELKLLQVFQKIYRQQKEQLDLEVSEAWNRYVTWSKVDALPEGSNVNTAKQQCEHKLSIGADINKPVRLPDLVLALRALALLDTKLQIFAKRFMTSLIQPIIRSEASVSCQVVPVSGGVSKAEVSVSLREEISVQKEPSSRCQRAVVVIDNICRLFNFLSTHLLGTLLTGTEDLNVTLEENNPSRKVLMELVGGMIADEFVHMLINECLCPAVPSHKNDIKSFFEVQQAANSLQALLADLRFIGSSDTRLCECIRDVDVLFAEKRSNELLIEARLLITSHNHNTVSVVGASVNEDREPSGVVDSGQTPANLLRPDVTLSSSTFAFPRCQVSISVQQLISLAYNALNEGLAGSTQYACQMFSTVRNMFELFCHVAPVYHHSNMDAVPHTAALFHNDCMFIAHHLITLGHQFHLHLPPNMAATTFVDLVPHLRRIGTESFLKQLRRQRSILLECLKTAQGFTGVIEEDSKGKCRHAVEQVIHHLLHVASVWRDVLPPAVFLKTIGTLTNVVVQEMVSNVLCLQDISADEAAELHSLFSLFILRVRDAFVTSPNSEGLVVKTGDEDSRQQARANLLKYGRKVAMLEQVMVVLDASLQVIVDLWAAGKGPLANELTADQVKHLVRALFQNTEKRASALTKIK